MRLIPLPPTLHRDESIRLRTGLSAQDVRLELGAGAQIATNFTGSKPNNQLFSHEGKSLGICLH